MADVTATRFVLKDASGHNRATLEVVDNQTVLKLFNKSGRAFANLFESFDGDGVLYLNSGLTSAFMALYAENGSPTIFIFDKDGKISTFDSQGAHSVLVEALDNLPKLPAVTIPSISFLDPSIVDQGWTGVVKIHGSGFDNGSFALFDGAVPRTTFKSSTLLEAEVDVQITSTTGVKKVKVHTADGGVSDETDFVVRSPRY